MNDVSRRRRRVGASIALAAAVVGLSSIPLVATATTQTKFYSATGGWSLTPGFVGLADTLTATLGDETRSTQPFGSAELTLNSVPSADVQVVSLSTTPGPSGWSAQVLSGTPAVVLLTNTGSPVAPGQSVTVGVQVTPAAVGTITVGTVVKQSNNFSGSGNNFIHDSGTISSLTVSTLTLSFATEPPATIAQSVPGASYFVYFCVVVQTTPAAAGVPITVNYDAGHGNPGLLFGTSAVTASGITVTTDPTGKATFGDSTCSSGLAATNVGSGFELSATSPAASGAAPSSPFQVTPTCVTTCTTSATSLTTGTTANVSATDSTTGGAFQIFVGFGKNPSLACESLVTGTGTGLVPDPLEVQTSSGSVSGTVTFVFPKSVVNALPNNGTPLMPVCVGASDPFLRQDPLTDQPAPYPYQGLLYDCTDPFYMANKGSPSTLQICVVSRAKIGHGAEQVVVSTNNLSDPGYW